MRTKTPKIAFTSFAPFAPVCYAMVYAKKKRKAEDKNKQN